jgi:hypothetical protein
MSLTVKSNISDLIEIAIASAIVGMSGQNDLRNTITPYAIPAGMGSINVPKFAVTAASKVSEGQNGSSSQLVSAGTNLNPVDSAFVKFNISDVAQASARTLVEAQGKIAGRKLQARYNQDIFAQFDSATMNVGDGNSEISVSLVKEARRKLLEKDAIGPFYLVLTPHLWDELNEDLATNYDVLVSDNQAEQILSGAGTVTLFGVNPVVVASGISETTAIKTALYSSQAIGWGYLADMPIKAKVIESDTATQFILHAPYDVKIVDADSIVEIHAKGTA